MHSYHALPKIAWNRCWSIKYGSSKFARKFVCCQVAEIPYSGKLSREKTFARIGDFRGENYRGLLVFAAPKDATPSNFAEKTFARIATKPRNSRKFSPSKVSRYMVFMLSLFFIFQHWYHHQKCQKKRLSSHICNLQRENEGD